MFFKHCASCTQTLCSGRCASGNVPQVLCQTMHCGHFCSKLCTSEYLLHTLCFASTNWSLSTSGALVEFCPLLAVHLALPPRESVAGFTSGYWLLTTDWALVKFWSLLPVLFTLSTLPLVTPGGVTSSMRKCPLC